MIRVVFEKKKIIVDGHANFDEYGKDIVCAGVSVLAQYVAYLLAFYGAKFKKKEGNLTIYDIPENEHSKIIIETLKEALKDIEKKYPKHLKVTEVI